MTGGSIRLCETWGQTHEVLVRDEGGLRAFPYHRNLTKKALVLMP